MVEVRASRLAQEVLADEGSVAATSRLDVQAASLFDATAEVRCSRMAVEVLASEESLSAASRLDVQAASLFDGTAEVRCSRMAMEVLAAPDAQASASRLDVQAASLFDATAEVRCSRMTVECLARQGSAGPVIPLPLVDDAHIFLHNWATSVEVRTSFLNNSSGSPVSGATSRRGLGVKPFRTMKIEWLVCPGELDLSDLERLEVFLRRMGDQRFPMPIYPDQQETSVAHVSADTTLVVNTSRARFFQGARVAIVRLDANDQVVGFSFHQIDAMTNASLTFASSIGVDVPAGSMVFPIMDCEIALEVKADYLTARVPKLSITVAEVPGASQLPPTKSDLPTGATVAHDGRPIWFQEPDWSGGIIKGRSRQGSRSRSGARADFVNTEATRSRQTHKFQLHGERDEMWDVLEFFETRRGRLRSFWHIDQDQYMEPVNIEASGNFIGVSEIGDLTDFQEEFDAVGIVMEDGTYFVREVSIIQSILTVFQINMSTPIDSGLAASDVVRVARARLVTFAGDEFVEFWDNTGHMSCKVNLIEVLAEEDFPI